MSESAKPASRNLCAIASDAVLTFPTESVVLISINCLKISCASFLVASSICACEAGVKDTKRRNHEKRTAVLLAFKWRSPEIKVVISFAPIVHALNQFDLALVPLFRAAGFEGEEVAVVDDITKTANADEQVARLAEKLAARAREVLKSSLSGTLMFTHRSGV